MKNTNPPDKIGPTHTMTNLAASDRLGLRYTAHWLKCGLVFDWLFALVVGWWRSIGERCSLAPIAHSRRIRINLSQNAEDFASSQLP